MRMLGEQFNLVTKVINAKSSLGAAAGGSSDLQERITLAQSYSKVVMSIVVSLFILIVFSIALIKSNDEQLKKLSAGFIGSVLGYWLR